MIHSDTFNIHIYIYQIEPLFSRSNQSLLLLVDIVLVSYPRDGFLRLITSKMIITLGDDNPLFLRILVPLLVKRKDYISRTSS